MNYTIQAIANVAGAAFGALTFLTLVSVLGASVVLLPFGVASVVDLSFGKVAGIISYFATLSAVVFALCVCKERDDLIDKSKRGE